jgi:hypothetical protein
MVQDCDQALRFCAYKGAAAPGQGGPGAGRAGSGSLDLQVQVRRGVVVVWGALGGWMEEGS